VSPVSQDRFLLNIIRILVEDTFVNVRHVLVVFLYHMFEDNWNMGILVLLDGYHRLLLISFWKEVAQPSVNKFSFIRVSIFLQTLNHFVDFGLLKVLEGLLIARKFYTGHIGEAYVTLYWPKREVPEISSIAHILNVVFLNIWKWL